MNSCCGCKHWKPSREGDVGRCLRITAVGATSDNKAVVIEGDIGDSHLVTAADFSCCLFEAAPVVKPI